MARGQPEKNNQVNCLLNLLQVHTLKILNNKIKFYEGDIRILEMPRRGMAQNRLGTTALNRYGDIADIKVSDKKKVYMEVEKEKNI